MFSIMKSVLHSFLAKNVSMRLLTSDSDFYIPSRPTNKFQNFINTVKYTKCGWYIWPQKLKKIENRAHGTLKGADGDSETKHAKMLWNDRSE